MQVKVEGRGKSRIKVVENCGYRFIVTIPSRLRSELILQSPFLPVANVYVHEDELETYQRALGGLDYEVRLFGHTEKFYMHYALKRLYKPKKHNFMMTIDDDVHGLMNVFTRTISRGPVRSLEKLLDIFTRDYIIARDIPTGAFIYSNARTPKERSTFNPFSLRAWGPAACMGIIDGQVWPDANVINKFDADWCLQFIAKHKVLWQDNRYHLWSTIEDRPQGGLAAFRSDDGQMKAIAYLRAKWGPDVIGWKGRIQRGQLKTFTVTVPQKFDVTSVPGIYQRKS